MAYHFQEKLKTKRQLTKRKNEATCKSSQRKKCIEREQRIINAKTFIQNQKKKKKAQHF